MKEFEGGAVIKFFTLCIIRAIVGKDIGISESWVESSHKRGTVQANFGFSNVGRRSSSTDRAKVREKLKREIKRIEVLERSELVVLS